MFQLIRRLWVQDDGQGLVEYAFILAFIAIAVIASVREIAPKIEPKYVSVETAFE
ncbi:MAG TPA: Flp family type IVb pilin [Desulfobacteria bacterium]|nr:Flp family type IVb pilin [Desulfobacteria bacterium]